MKQQDLITLLRSGIRENWRYEFKMAHGLKKDLATRIEITRDISALANADGGMIFYGVTEYDGPDDARLLDPVDRSKFSHDWLKQLVDEIDPKIPKLDVDLVTMDGNEERCVYVVTIPRGLTAHQAKDLHFYQKGSHGKGTPLRYYQIRDIMGRQVHPTIETTITVTLFGGTWVRNGECGRFHVRLKNTSEVAAREGCVILNLPLKVWDRWYEIRTASGEPVGQLSNAGGEEHFWQVTLDNVGGRSLYPTASQDFQFAWFQIPPMELTPRRGDILHTTYADSMPPVHGSFTEEQVRVFVT